MQHGNLLAVAALGVLLLAAACGGGRDSVDGDAPADTAQAAAPAPAASSGPVALGTPGEGNGRVIEIKMITDEQGNRFEPNAVSAKEHDVLRFTLVSGGGVHNVSFPAARNPGVQGLPAPSELMQAAGQTKEYVVGLKPGSYYFQCDPHAALGMTGTLNVGA
ncbi:plastocyanin/azurin family copper-binding protein [Longimicrobium sp.]|uniref:plastocyanin/azurin family copper-binding protein n=1 Tax=Longimicrobium sp. TaxID=2029185 RepID=UPI002C6C3204|nr:plastocyanin/azurin family copper-binding protein [Longimicrobium sp.]HSU16390.1 plastocyanin/azurin family copper-binding protein [Longimicrobium sp.]